MKRRLFSQLNKEQQQKALEIMSDKKGFHISKDEYFETYFGEFNILENEQTKEIFVVWS